MEEVLVEIMILLFFVLFLKTIFAAAGHFVAILLSYAPEHILLVPPLGHSLPISRPNLVLQTGQLLIGPINRRAIKFLLIFGPSPRIL